MTGTDVGCTALRSLRHVRYFRGLCYCVCATPCPVLTQLPCLVLKEAMGYDMSGTNVGYGATRR
eukprot:3009826-Rhodomonas_salina.2